MIDSCTCNKEEEMEEIIEGKRDDEEQEEIIEGNEMKEDKKKRSVSLATMNKHLQVDC